MQHVRIAIVGAACRYPDANSPEELWENVLAQRRAFRRIPAERLSLADYFSADRAVADAIYSTEAAVIADYEFDRNRFRVAGGTFRAVDMTHWLALEVAADALAAAGFPDAEGMPRAETGVYLGNSLTGEFSRANLMRLRWPYVRRVLDAALARRDWPAMERSSFLAALEESYKAPFPAVNDETLAGGLSNTIAGRICNYFDFKGGGYTVDGACASSLLSVATACSALTAGDIDMALAGGVDLSLDPFELIGFSKVGALAAEEMRVFDLHSAGFWPGEGCGAVVLMREEDALRQRREILASICGWGISSDGSGGLTRPEVEGQMLAMMRAYRRAGFGIETVGYFEGHGTGTGVGDTTELKALSQARREAGAECPPAALGSIKANIGHTKAAAGMAGLLKATLAAHYRLLPPTTGWNEPHPAIADEGHQLRLLRQGEVWTEDRPLRAAVSSMGFGGINAHVVLEGQKSARRRGPSPRERKLLGSVQDAELFLLAADSGEDLERKLEELEAVAARISRSDLADLACHLAESNPAGTNRAALVVSRPNDLVAGLKRVREWLAKGIERRLDVDTDVMLGSGVSRPSIGYLFSGQGTGFSRDGGRWSRRFPSVDDWYAVADIPRNGSDAATEIAQPAIIAASLAGLEILNRCGIEAAVAVGHSLGELAAYHWAGAIDKPALLRLARARGRGMAEHGRSGGAMASIGAGEETVGPAIAGRSLVLAGLNTPLQTVISGEAAAIDEMLDLFKGAGIAATKLNVSHAFHSPFMESAADVLLTALDKESFQPLAADVVSTITGAPLSADADLRQLLFRQMTTPVWFAQAVGQAQGKVDLWIEVGPGHVLAGMMPRLSDIPAVALDAGGSSLKGLWKAVAAAFVLGAPVSTEALVEGRFRRPFDLKHQLRFLTNPCELAPAGDVESAPVSPIKTAEAAQTVPMSANGRVGPTPMQTPLDVVRRMAAARAELPVETVGKDLRLLGDLHLSSIAVAQLVTESARALGLEPPVWPTEAANATIAEVAEALEELAAQGKDAPASVPDALDGIAAWVRPFAVELVEAPLVRRGVPVSASGTWTVIGGGDRPLYGTLLELLPREAPGGGVAVCLPPDPGEGEIDMLLDAARQATSRKEVGRFLFVQHGGGAAGFARALYLEVPHITVCVVDVPSDCPAAADWIATEVAAAASYTEAHYDLHGTRREPRLRVLPDDGPRTSMPLTPDDVLLVSGGGKGIGAECALALAHVSGAKLALLGRAHPEHDAELAVNLQRMAEHGICLHYESVDITDAEAVRRSVAVIESKLGAITAVLHSAGTNVPRRLESLDRAAFLRTVRPKVTGLQNLLAAIPSDRLRLLVGFGSIIARTGMPGEADYASANEWLTRLIERWQAQHPHCRCLSIEWSVWSGVGMGERLGRLESLRRQGITPIAPEAGVAMLKDLLVRRSSPVAVVVAGRFGEPPTLSVDRPEMPLFRFLQRPRLHLPGVELIVEADLSLDTDPYLGDHVYQGALLIPAVLGLEAMAQTARTLMDSAETPAFEDVAFTRPVVVPRDGPLTIRLVALKTGPDRVEVALRSQETGFQTDHFRAECVFGVAAQADDFAEGVTVLPAIHQPALLLDADRELYGGILFQRGRLQRVRSYRHLRATECVAEIQSRPDASWFSQYLPGQLVLGDPGARDAALHGIQACIPHGTLLPTGVDRLTIRAPLASKSFLHAHERSREGDDFVYDVDVTDEDGAVLERWRGLQLRCVRTAALKTPWAVPLLAVYLQRRLHELIPGTSASIALHEGRESNRRAAGNGAMRDALGVDVPVYHRGDGKPEACVLESISAAHSGNLALAISGIGAVACDLEAIAARSAATWHDLLGPQRQALAELITREANDSSDTAATQVWSAAECLKKAGAGFDAPLVLAAVEADGWVLLESGTFRIATVAVAVREQPHRLCAALLVETLAGND